MSLCLCIIQLQSEHQATNYGADSSLQLLALHELLCHMYPESCIFLSKMDRFLLKALHFSPSIILLLPQMKEKDRLHRELVPIQLCKYDPICIPEI
jgi:hypothetical protein